MKIKLVQERIAELINSLKAIRKHIELIDEQLIILAELTDEQLIILAEAMKNLA